MQFRIGASMRALQAPSEAPRHDPYASGGQNYYGAGWQGGAQANAPVASKPASKGSSGWGKLGFWGGGQPAEEPAQPAPDAGVLFYGAPEVRPLSRPYVIPTGKRRHEWVQPALLLKDWSENVRCVQAYAAPPPPTSLYPSLQPAQNLYGGTQPPPFMPAAQPQQGATPFGPPPAQARTSAANAPPFARAGVQPSPPTYAQPGDTPAVHAAQPVHMLSDAAQNTGSSTALPASSQQAPWQPSAQSTSEQQQASQQHAPPWLQGRPGNSTQSSYTQPQPAGNEQQLWQSSGPLDSVLQHQQEAAGTAPWQASSASAYPLANGAQHAETAPGSAGDGATTMGPGGTASTSNTPQEEPQQAIHSDDQMQAFSHPDMATLAYDGQGAQAYQSRGSALDAGPFGAADASEADFWGQHDAEVLLEGPFASTTLQQGGPITMDKPEQGSTSMAAAWADERPEREQDVRAMTAHATAEAPAERPGSISSSVTLHDGAVAASQGPPSLGESPAVPAVEQQTILHGSAPNSTAAGQPGTAQLDAGLAVTPFGSEAAQNWQTAGSAALPLPDQLPTSTEHSAGAEGPQAWMASQDWAAADSSGVPEQDKFRHVVPEHQPTDQPLAVEGHQAWLQPHDPSRPDTQAGGTYASYGTHESGTAVAGQLGGAWHPAQYAAAGQPSVPTWQEHKVPHALEHSSHASTYEAPSTAWQESQAAGNWSGNGTYGQQQGAAPHSVQQQTGPAYMHPAVATSGARFKGGQNAWTAQQRRVPSDADAGAVAVTTLTCPQLWSVYMIHLMSLSRCPPGCQHLEN